MRLDLLVHDPIVPVVGLVAVIAIKTLAAAGALALLGLSWRGALGMGLGLAQLGELSFVLLLEGVNQNVLSPLLYNRMLFIALGTLIATPELLKRGLRWAEAGLEAVHAPAANRGRHLAAKPIPHALVIGAGPIGSQIASQLEISGIDACLIDLSPVNLHPFAQQGFATVAGDATDAETLRHAHVEQIRLAVVTVPDDAVAKQIVVGIRDQNTTCTIVVRCRYQTNAAGIRRAGANAVVSEESVASTAMLRLVEQVKDLAQNAGKKPAP
jgi:CPA2 family monovalent cation:H+ antiporter-2